MRRLWTVFGTSSILSAACTSTPTATQPELPIACIDAAKVRGLYEAWAHETAETNLSDGVDMAQVAASLRAAREILLELALATAADPVAAGHFEDRPTPTWRCPRSRPTPPSTPCPAARSAGSSGLLGAGGGIRRDRSAE